MRKIFGIGETVLDIIFKNGQPIGAVPGGSTYNGMISLGRAGLEAWMISETGNDRVGQRIVDFARENGLNVDNIYMYPGTKSPLSLAFLNENNDAEYIFYKDHPHDRLEFSYPDVQADDIVLFGSYYALNPVIRQQVKGFLDYAHERGAILYYDVNFRPSHANDVVKLKPNLIENLELADVVRGSHEDFEVLFGLSDADRVYQAEVSFYCRQFIYTQGARPVALRTQRLKKEYPIEPVATVSTIGAGDNFNAGFIYGLVKHGITRRQLEEGLQEELWDSIIGCAQQFSAECCQSINNFIGEAFAQKMKLN